MDNVLKGYKDNISPVVSKPPVPFAVVHWDYHWSEETPLWAQELATARRKAINALFEMTEVYSANFTQNEANTLALYQCASQLEAYAVELEQVILQKTNMSKQSSKRTQAFNFAWCFVSEEDDVTFVACLQNSYAATECVCCMIAATCIMSRVVSTLHKIENEQIVMCSEQKQAAELMQGYCKKLISWQSGEDRALFSTRQWNRLMTHQLPLQFQTWWPRYMFATCVHRFQLYMTISLAKTGQQDNPYLRGAAVTSRKVVKIMQECLVNSGRNTSNFQIKLLQQIYDLAISEWLAISSQHLILDTDEAMRQALQGQNTNVITFIPLMLKEIKSKWTEMKTFTKENVDYRMLQWLERKERTQTDAQLTNAYDNSNVEGEKEKWRQQLKFEFVTNKSN